MQSPSHPSPEPTASTSVATKRHWGVILLWITPVLFVAGVLLYYGLLTRQGADSDTWLPRVGQPLADFTLPDLHGRMVQLSALRGKVVFINVWATWCKPTSESAYYRYFIVAHTGSVPQGQSSPGLSAGVVPPQGGAVGNLHAEAT